MHPQPKIRINELLVAGGGSMSFSRFMQHALYDSRDGYYTNFINAVGRRGDFSTSATLSHFFGNAVAGWLRSVRPSLGTWRWNVIEIGAGSGELAESILRSLTQRERFFLQYIIVEKSPPLLFHQQQKLSSRGVKWFSTMEEALHFTEGQAIIFSNEVVDAFPCHELRWDGENWNELHLTLGEQDIQEEWRPLPTDFIKRNPSCLFTDHAPLTQGQRCELHSSFFEWQRKWIPFFKKGMLLTIDYGDIFPELYYRRPDGTLRAYFNHITLEGTDIYRRMGHQDITADVNFTDLQQWGETLGLKNDFLMNQRDFFLKFLPDAANLISRHHELSFLASESGAGSAYKVLCQLPVENF